MHQFVTYSTIILTLFLMSPNHVHADATNLIDEQVWRPLIASWKTMDAQAQVALYDDEITRVSESMGFVGQGAPYLEQMEDRMDRMARAGMSSSLEFKFTSRLRSENTAWESGIYRVVMTHPERGEKVQYAEFNVLLKKMDGHWKISMDADRTSSEEAFLAVKNTMKNSKPGI